MYQALPTLIEMEPLKGFSSAEIAVPGSKSITNRALVLAALADRKVTLRGALWSEDTQIMVEALGKLGFEVRVEADPREAGNRMLEVSGLGGMVWAGGTAEKPLEIFVGNAGTAARFLAAFVCLGEGVYELRGTPRMHERPQSALFAALRELGYRVESGNDRLPVRIFGGGPRRGSCMVRIEESSQFASALMLSGRTGGWSVKVAGESEEESPYVVMTQRLIEAFPFAGGDFQVEADASSASYFWGAGWLLGRERAEEGGSLVRVAAFPRSDWQIDSAFPRFLPLPEVVSRRSDLGDSIMTAMVLAPFAEYPVRFTDLERLRVQECERVAALRTELTKCGGRVVEEGESLTVYPGGSGLHGARIATYNDHRMAMCFAVLGLRVAGIQMENPGCVRKTFPNFFQKLAAAPPEGLGARILDGATGRVLALEELFAG